MSTHAITVWFASCDHCGWQSPQKGTQEDAQKALTSHQTRRCRAVKEARRIVAPVMKGSYDGKSKRPAKTR